MQRPWLAVLVSGLMLGCAATSPAPLHFANGAWHGRNAENAGVVGGVARSAITNLNQYDRGWARRPDYGALYSLKELERVMGPEDFQLAFRNDGVDQELRATLERHLRGLASQRSAGRTSPDRETPPHDPDIVTDPLWGLPPPPPDACPERKISFAINDGALDVADNLLRSPACAARRAEIEIKLRPLYRSACERRAPALIALKPGISKMLLNRCPEEYRSRLAILVKSDPGNLSCTERVERAFAAGDMAAVASARDDIRCRPDASAAAKLHERLEQRFSDEPCLALRDVQGLVKPAKPQDRAPPPTPPDASLAPARRKTLAAECLARGRAALASRDFSRAFTASDALEDTSAIHGMNGASLLDEIVAAAAPNATDPDARAAFWLRRARELAPRHTWAAAVAARLAARRHRTGGAVDPQLTRGKLVLEEMGHDALHVEGRSCEHGRMPPDIAGAGASAISVTATVECAERREQIDNSYQQGPTTTTSTTLQGRNGRLVAETTTSTTPGGTVTNVRTVTTRTTVVRLVVTDRATGQSIERSLTIEPRKATKTDLLMRIDEASRAATLELAAARGARLVKEAKGTSDPNAQLELAARALVLSGPTPDLVPLLERAFGKLGPDDAWPSF